MNILLIWLLMVPLVLSVISIFAVPEINRQFSIADSAKIATLFAIGGMVFVAGMFHVGKGVLTDDRQLLNGKITGKARTQGTYEESYQCNCRTVSSGSGNSRTTSTQCDTCYRTHYTVAWDVGTSINYKDRNLGVHIWDVDSLSSAVYLTPDPGRFVTALPGQPCSIAVTYTNYIKAVPESLFRPTSEDLKKQFAYMIPQYPENLRDLWEADRVLGGGFRIPENDKWNAMLSNTLITLGPDKQANVVIVFAATTDPSYAYALQDAWLGGKKNDIVVIIGVSDFPKKAAWSQVLAWTDNEDFKIKLRDDILALDTLSPEAVIGTVDKDTRQYYKRKRMHDYEYLDAEINPPSWMIWTIVLMLLAAYTGFWLYCTKNRRFSNRRIY